MPRCLSSKELWYLLKLIHRNYSLITKGEDAGKIWSKGLESPMSGKERAMRARLRRKAVQMAIDLCLIWAAGVAPGGEIKSKSASEFVREIGIALAGVNLDMAEGKVFLPGWLSSILPKDLGRIRRSPRRDSSNSIQKSQ